jgi:hypothetical protein
MQNICLLFAGRRGLDDFFTRNSVFRIPEVSRKLKETQRLLEYFLGSQNNVDLYSYVLSSEEDFNSHPNLKSLVAATVQIGLFDRFVKYRSRPEFLVGRVNGCSAMHVCAGLQSFEAFVETSDHCKENSVMARFSQQPETRLTGVKLEEFGALRWNPEGFYQELHLDKKNAAELVDQLNVSSILSQCVHVGPYFDFHISEMENAGVLGIPSMSSIEMDPILNSFWKTAI